VTKVVALVSIGGGPGLYLNYVRAVPSRKD